MPNSLAHIGLHIPLLKAALPHLDIRWLYLGCIVPDLPWILQRLVVIIWSDLDPITLRVHVIVQSSLLFCLLVSLGFACIAERKWIAGCALALGSLLHLLLDATQTKWANGVQLLAPWRWDLLNFGWYWPESWLTYLMTALGVLMFAWFWRASLLVPWLLDLRWRWWLAASLILVIYLVAPLFFTGEVMKANSHYVATVENPNRAGQPVEFDRRIYKPLANDSGQVELFGRLFKIEGLDLAEQELISVKGQFVDDDRIQVTDYHVHASGLRDYFSMLGLLLIGLSMLVGLMRGRLAQEIK